MRIWSILYTKSDLKWCIHLSRSLYSYYNKYKLKRKCCSQKHQDGTSTIVKSDSLVCHTSQYNRQTTKQHGDATKRL